MPKQMLNLESMHWTSSGVYLVRDSKLGPQSGNGSKNVPAVQVLYQTLIFFTITKHI